MSRRGNPRIASAAVVVLLGALLTACGSSSPGGSSSSSPTAPSSSGSGSGSGSGTGSGTDATWDFNGQTWQASGTPPACASPLTLRAPADLSLATSVLYPGQTRGGNYKPHGGLRFDNSGQSNNVAVTAPLDGVVYRGARYIESGEVQYLFDIMNSCGILYRLDHLRTLSSRFQAMADALPAASAGSSATTPIGGAQRVSAGESIGTAVGVAGNVFFDWGVYDLRARNAASANAAWLADHGGELAPYGICWLDNLSGSDSARVRSLPPGDQTAGSTSDYCR